MEEEMLSGRVGVSHGQNNGSDGAQQQQGGTTVVGRQHNGGGMVVVGGQDHQQQQGFNPQVPINNPQLDVAPPQLKYHHRHPYHDEKPRFLWTEQLHNLFAEAVDKLGGPHVATPKRVMLKMGVKGLSIKQIKSHLQKYRQGKPLGRFWKETSRNPESALSVSEDSGGSSRSVNSNMNNDTEALPSREYSQFNLQAEAEKSVERKMLAETTYMEMAIRNACNKVFPNHNLVVAEEDGASNAAYIAPFPVLKSHDYNAECAAPASPAQQNSAAEYTSPFQIARQNLDVPESSKECSSENIATVLMQRQDLPLLKNRNLVPTTHLPDPSLDIEPLQPTSQTAVEDFSGWFNSPRSLVGELVEACDNDPEDDPTETYLNLDGLADGHVEKYLNPDGNETSG